MFDLASTICHVSCSGFAEFAPYGLTVEQRIARKEAELARLKAGRRQLENGQKIIIGSMMLEAARRDLKTRIAILRMIGEKVTRDIDKQRLAPIVAELEALPRDTPRDPA